METEHRQSVRRGRRLKSDGAVPASSHEDEDEDEDEGHRTPPNPRMSLRAGEEREEAAGLLARIDEINEEKDKLTEQLKQQQVAGITDDYFDEKTAKILAAGALHGSRSSHVQARMTRLPMSRDSSEAQGRRGLSAPDRQQLLELVNRRKSAGGAGGAKWRQGEARRQGEAKRQGEHPASATASASTAAGGSSESTAPPSRRENGVAQGSAAQAGGSAAQAQVAADCVTRLPRGGLHVETVHGAVQFGIPPETIKDSITRFGSPPHFYVVPQERFNLTTGTRSAAKVPAPLGSASARRLRLLRGRLAALGSSALPGRGRPTGRPAVATALAAAQLHAQLHGCCMHCIAAAAQAAPHHP
jgi:hypothetical protein